MSFNCLKTIPPELGDCENLEKLDLSGNLELTELPFEVSLDISINSVCKIFVLPHALLAEILIKSVEQMYGTS